MPDRVANAKAPERRRQAFELRKAGASYVAIASAINVTPTSARRYVIRILDDLHAQSLDLAERYRTMQLERLNDMVLALNPRVKQGDPGAIRALLAVMEREAKLLGLDAPTKTDVTLRIREAATAAGLDPDEVLAEAEQVLRQWQ